MPSKSRDKGYRYERKVVEWHQRDQVVCERVPLSGGAGGSFSGDVVISETPLRGEVKARKDGQGFKKIEDWLGSNDILFLYRDRKDPMVVLSPSVYITLIQAYHEQESNVN